MENRKIARKEIRSTINRMEPGSIITHELFPNKNRLTINTYLGVLNQSDHLERVSLGCYKILKKVRTKPKGRKKGQALSCTLTKDLSPIPSILETSEEGLVMKQIFNIYKRMTPPETQVNMLYLYRLMKYAESQGVVKYNGSNIRLRESDKGPPPKRIVLVNKNITNKEWEQVVSDYRLYYQYKKENKVGRKKKAPSVIKKINSCQSILEHFGEDRNNPNKKYIEDYFIQQTKKYLDNKKVKCIVITGPDYHHHINSLFTTIADRVTVCEIAPDVFNLIYRKAQTCPHYIEGKVALVKDDINNYYPIDCQYSDIDLMRSIKYNYELILNQIKRQDASCDKNHEKFITFTFTRRYKGGIETIEKYMKRLLMEAFQSELSCITEGVDVNRTSERLKSCKQHQLNMEKPGRINEIFTFTYQDDVPMMNVLVVYK
jgi:hypothetical protein